MALIPHAHRCQVWLDFDGTLTTVDFLDELIGKYSRDDSWKGIEEQWRRGEIGSRACLEAEFSLLRLSPEQLNQELDELALDPGTLLLLETLENFKVPTTILSDGIEGFISRVLTRAGAKVPRIRANALDRVGDELRLRCPHSSATCRSASAHCKCSSRDALGEGGRVSIYVGDGRSDLCASVRCEVIFAKGALAAGLDAAGVSYRKFSTLLDVTEQLLLAWSVCDGQTGIQSPEQRA